MSSIREQIIARMVVILTNTTGAADRVYRSREAALSRDDATFIVITPDTEESIVFSGGNVDENTLVIDLEIGVRGDPWDALADPIAVDAHRLLMKDDQLQALVTRIRKIGSTWEGKDADLTAGALTTKYHMKYLSRCDDLAVTI